MKPESLECFNKEETGIYISKLKHKDRVKFRNKGESVIEHTSHNGLFFLDCCYGGGVKYKEDGRIDIEGQNGISHKHPFDIIEILSAAFNWDDVKPGMAFKNASYKCFHYVGVGIDGQLIFDFFKSPIDDSSRYDSFGDLKTSHLCGGITRTPEHDIEVK